MLCQNVLIEAHLKNIFLEVLLDVADGTIKDLVAFVYQHDVVTDLFHLFHAVGTEDDGGTFFCQSEDLIFDKIGIHRIQSAERFIQYDQFGFVYHSGHELQLLAHAFGKVFNLFVPPAFHLEFDEPFLDILHGLFFERPLSWAR